MLTFERLLVPLPDVPDLVHGIVSTDPPKVQCDGCGLVATGTRLGVLVLTCGIRFHSRRYDLDPRRLCEECRAAEWPEVRR